LSSQADTMGADGRLFFKALDGKLCEYVIVVNDDGEGALQIGKIAAFHIQSLMVAYKERFDRENFIKNLLMDNLLLVDIYSRAKKLRIDSSVRRVVYLIEAPPDKDMVAVEIVRSIFPAKSRDFVTAVDERNIILVKELRDKDTSADVEKLAKTISDMRATESMKKAHVSIGSIVADLKDVSVSYKEAKMASEIGRIFWEDRVCVNFEKLGIGRLIYQLPVSLCKMFVDEVLHDTTMEQFDDEILSTMRKFMENDLNVSETSRQLYIHRNTLVYRLDKVQKMTGLDLRKFEDAVIFELTMMVNRYMKYKAKSFAN
jgi:carbohydrate diacid regulator